MGTGILMLSMGKLDRKLKVIHVGDMYELWQGMGEWGSYFDDSGKGIILEEGAVEKISARVLGIEEQNEKIISEFKCLDTLGATTYLYGNHDVYLLDLLRKKNSKWNAALADRPARLAYFDDDNIFAEHGHRMDDFNQDGKWAGPFITELVYYLPQLRWLDPDRRPQYHRLVAIDLYYRKRFRKDGGFSVYVMGHTHKPDLAKIEVYRKPGEIPGSFCLDCHKGTELYRRYSK